MSDYGFVERFRWSQKNIADRVYEVASEQLGATNVREGTESDDRHGADWWAEVPHCGDVGIDIKKRSGDWPDVNLETRSVVERGVPGWAVSPKAGDATDYFLWLWPSRSLLLSAYQVRAATRRHRDEWERLYPQQGRDGMVRDTSTDGGRYHTRNVYVPELVLLDAMHPDLRTISSLPSKDVWRALPRRCFTCGRPPDGRFPDGSPSYRCTHPPIRLMPTEP